jgi:hypothetical protein
MQRVITANFRKYIFKSIFLKFKILYLKKCKMKSLLKLRKVSIDRKKLKWNVTHYGKRTAFAEGHEQSTLLTV